MSRWKRLLVYGKNARAFTTGLFDRTVEKYDRKPYTDNNVDAMKKALDEMKKQYGIDWGEMK